MIYYVAKTGSLWFVLGVRHAAESSERRFFSLDGTELPKHPTNWGLESFHAYESLDAALEAARTMKANAERRLGADR
jgi:hypothetical protein